MNTFTKGVDPNTSELFAMKYGLHKKYKTLKKIKDEDRDLQLFNWVRCGGLLYNQYTRMTKILQLIRNEEINMQIAY